MISMPNHADVPSRIKIWDVPTRLFHWTLLIACTIAWLTATRFNTISTMRWHLLAGYVTLALLLFRLLWGIWGSRNNHFVYLWQEAANIPGYLPTLFQRHSHYRIGHNPLGSLAVMLLLLAVASVTVTGLFTNDAVSTAGPWAHWVSDASSETLSSWHAESFDILAALVVLHVGAILFYRFFKYDDLLSPMITGDKPLPPETKTMPERVQMDSNLRAVIFLLLAASVTTLIAFTPGQ